MAAAAPSVLGARSAVTPLEWGYRGSFVATSIALTALSFYSLPYFMVGCTVAALGHAIAFNSVVCRSSSSNGIKHWTFVASFIASCVAISLVFRSTPTLVEGVQSLKGLELSDALFDLMIFPLVAGYGIPIAQALYERGLELLQMPKFEPMEFYLSRSQEYKNLVSLFLDKCAFACGVIAPGCLDYLPFTRRIQILTIPFCSKELQEERYGHLLSLCEIYPPKEACLLWETALNYLFIQQQKWNLLPTIVQQSHLMPPEMKLAFEGKPLFPEEVSQQIEQKKQAVDQNYSAKLTDFQRRLTSIKESLATLKGNLQKAAVEAQIDADAANLLKEIDNEYEQIKIFNPDLDTNELKKCWAELRMGALQEKIQAIRSKNKADRFDGDQDTWEYFLSLPDQGPPLPHPRPPQYLSYIRLLRLFHIAVPAREDVHQTQEALQAALKKSKIETMGAFVQKILSGDTARLQNPTEVLDALEAYLKDDRQILYRKLAGKVTEKAHVLMFVAARITYLAVMTLIALAPLYAYPEMAIAGFICSLPYYATPSLQDILLLTLIHPSLAGVLSIFQIAARRPFLSLIRGGHSALMDTYDTSSFLGKLRILGVELMYTSLLMRAQNQGIAIGGVATGASIGREVWGYFWPQNVRRQYFIDRGESVG